MLGKIAAIVSLTAFVPYIISILKRKTIPSRATWWIWSIVGVLVFLSYRETGAKETLWIAITYIIGPFIIGVLSIKYGVGGWTIFERICLIGSALITVLWFFSHSAITALILYLLIDLIGILPTIYKSYLHPDQEDKLAWFLLIVANTINLFAVEELSFQLLVYPIYMLTSGCVVFLVLLKGRTEE